MQISFLGSQELVYRSCCLAHDMNFRQSMHQLQLNISGFEMVQQSQCEISAMVSPEIPIDTAQQTEGCFEHPL